MCNKLGVWQEDKDHLRVKRQLAALQVKHERLVRDLNTIAKRCGDCGFVAVESAILKALAESEGE